MPRRRPRDKLGTSQGHLGHLGLIMCKSILKGQNVPGQKGISPDRWDVSPGQTGRKPGGVPPKFFMFIGFFFPYLSRSPHFHVRCLRIVRKCSRERSLERCHSHACMCCFLLCSFSVFFLFPFHAPNKGDCWGDPFCETLRASVKSDPKKAHKPRSRDS